MTTFIWIVIILLIWIFHEQLIQGAVFIGFFAAIGALLFWIFGGDASTGATIGFWFGVFIGIKVLMESLGAEYSTIFEYAYYLLSLPLWFSNRLQHILSEPWRYIFKTNWLGESAREVVRPTLFVIQIILYVLITPLRFVNAVCYNIIVYGVTELYDLFFEVLQPSQHNEGRGSWWTWLYMFPVRLIHYPIFHGSLVLIEGFVWTVIDTFVPAVTLYHGTDLTAGQAIARKIGTRWTDGTFTSSRGGWGGYGVYFGSRRNTAKGYAYDSWRLSDNNPVMIVCRVSLGTILNYSLAPDYVYRNAGQYGDSAELNKYANKHGYTTGEWWNSRGGYWEFCLFDWQNRYNHPWRIRPIYVFNFRTGRAEHIESGLRHWLFSKPVINDITNNAWLATLLVVAVIALFVFGYYLLDNWTLLTYRLGFYF